MIQLFSNSLGKEEIKEVEKVFKSGWIGFGKETNLFEKEFAAKIGAPAGVLSVNSCTAALFMSMKILGIGRGDEVIIPSVSFVGAANAVLDAGAKPVFCDVDLEGLNIIPSEISRLRNRRTKAVILLHYGGHPCDMDEIYKHTGGLKIIEDSANAIVSKYKGKNCGTLGDIGCFSFDAMKFIAVGDGGAIVVNDRSLLEKALEARYMGIKNRQAGMDSLKDKKDRWWEIELGSSSNRYVTNDIASAIGRVQLRKLDSFVARRKEVWHQYKREFSNLDWLRIPPEPGPQTQGSYYLFWVRLDNGATRDRLAVYLTENDIYCTFRYFPLHLIDFYKSKHSLANAEFLNEVTLNLPLHQNLSDNDAAKIVKTVKKFSRKL